MNPFYITTPIYYLNGVPHIGHAYTTLLADVLARYHRLRGVPTHFLTGTDEHGQKVFEAATEAGLSPQEHTDRLVENWKSAWERLDITHDDFMRTTESRHTDVVQKVLQDLYDRGEIYQGEYTGWYCKSEEIFYTEKDLVDGRSPEGNAVEQVVETNYFFRMSQHQEWLVDYIESNPTFIQPDFRRNETLGFLKQPLRDLCISRPKARVPWGIEMPWDPDHVCYVWFDALLNYASAVGYGVDTDRFDRWWKGAIHLIGKDILTTHTVYWPTMLHAMGVEMPRAIFAHGWWLTGETKMAKSLGNVISPLDMLDTYGVDALRYYLAAEMSVGADATFTEEGFIRRYNTDLANDLGNFASRVLKMIHRHLDGTIPDSSEDLGGAAETALRASALGAADDVEAAIDTVGLDRAVARIMATVREANRYFDRTAPWKMTGDDDRAELSRVLYHGAEVLRIVSGLLFPVIPGKMGELRMNLGLGDAPPSLAALKQWGGLQVGTALPKPESLFPRIRPVENVPSKEAKMTTQKEDPTPEGVQIGIDDVGRVELRTAVVLEAERVEGADRLLRLEVDLGKESRQIVAGIAEHYAPEDLVGRTIVVVANLQPATIRGVESRGMLLAAKKGKKLCLVTTDGDAEPGWSVG